ncbi:MAG TPA: T9SS type A sorting domain-containing protein, partial [Chitinophagaceae bacterium]|nr:T9SS type A sorting domain-containing protein [Chitinophagaceae bacterium]
HDLFILGDGCSVGLSSPTNGTKYFYLSSQNGGVFRASLDPADNQFAGEFTGIKPQGAQGDFITLFYLDPDNTEDLYFASNDTLFRTTAASQVSSTTWTRMSGVNSSITGEIRSMATTRGSYGPGHNLFFGTDGGKVYRIRDPQNALPATIPVDISDPGMEGVVIGVAVNPRNDDTIMAVISNYDTQSIWWTGNANDSIPVWQAIEGSGSGNLQAPSIRSCAIVATQTGVEYFVGTQIGLYSTTRINGANTSWTPEVHSGPLQYAIVSSLALRWSDNTLVVGTHGNGMFFTSIGSATGITPPPDTGSIFIRTLYPTLFTGTMNIQVGTLSGVTGIRIFIFNMVGQESYEAGLPYQNESLNLGFLPDGMYVVYIVSEDGTHRYTRKIIRQ